MSHADIYGRAVATEGNNKYNLTKQFTVTTLYKTYSNFVNRWRGMFKKELKSAKHVFLNF